MTAVLRTIHLHGALARFGGPYALAVASPREAVHALCAQIKGLRAAIRAGAFHVYRGPMRPGHDIDADLAAVGFGKTREMHLMPALEGAGRSGKAVAKIVLGVALIGVGLGFAFLGAGATGLAGSALFGLTTNGGIALAGASMVLGGVSQLLSPQPQRGPTVGAERQDSFVFQNGAVNLIEEGNPVPVAYGRCRIGSVIVSAGLDSERITQGTGTAVPGYGLGYLA